VAVMGGRGKAAGGREVYWKVSGLLTLPSQLSAQTNSTSLVRKKSDMVYGAALISG
jgi:hypothetical protein